MLSLPANADGQRIIEHRGKIVAGRILRSSSRSHLSPDEGSRPFGGGGVSRVKCQVRQTLTTLCAKIAKGAAACCTFDDVDVIRRLKRAYRLQETERASPMRQRFQTSSPPIGDSLNSSRRHRMMRDIPQGAIFGKRTCPDLRGLKLTGTKPGRHRRFNGLLTACAEGSSTPSMEPGIKQSPHNGPRDLKKQGEDHMELY